MSGAPLLTVTDLTIEFPSSRPVNNLSFDIAEGETLAIVGESGSGKSLTALAIMGLLPRSATISGGRIAFEGSDISKIGSRAMRTVRGKKISMIFQEPMTSLNPVITVGYQIVEALRQHQSMRRSQARARAIELLDLVRIPDPDKRVDSYPHELSGGMRQRVMIAIAVACEPRLLIADEPTTALDVTIQAQILDLLDSLRRQLSLSVLLITHDLAVVAQWANRVVVMYAGRKVEEASAEAFVTSPSHPYTRGLLSASPRSHPDLHYRNARLTEIPGNILSASGEPGCGFRPRCDRARVSCADRVPELQSISRQHVVACPYFHD